MATHPGAVRLARSDERGEVAVVNDHKVVRVLAWLMRNECVSVEAVDRAIGSALDMRVGELVALSGTSSEDSNAIMRHAFLREQVGRISEEQ